MTTENMFHIAVYSVVQDPTSHNIIRTMSDANTSMQVFEHEDIGKKLSHNVLKRFVADPDDEDWTVTHA
jgi:hypothetical protein